ncbi:hypothetical protein [Ktedonobacter racemifer]|uniref:Uncharacterized protein n=1 Tax=Ktedonobacter racemifer DSM 44963 TaxID=485913 RepID=D6U1X6_KTERA|nr:hypothetical protein [Ktedonobacter racemifer]EFH80860.1 hypothetical protein Krac_1492 [Ktedonobacter racemifer DSM 44963]
MSVQMMVPLHPDPEAKIWRACLCEEKNVVRARSRFGEEPMRVSESVVLPLPSRVQVMVLAALLFHEQYGRGVRIEVRGQVQGKGLQVHVFREWVEVGEFDAALDLVGLKDPGYSMEEEDEEEDGLRWVIPTGPGEYRLSERNERPGF